MLDVSAREIDVPAAAVAVGRSPKDDTAELEAAIEVLRLGITIAALREQPAAPAR